MIAWLFPYCHCLLQVKASRSPDIPAALAPFEAAWVQPFQVYQQEENTEVKHTNRA